MRKYLWLLLLIPMVSYAQVKCLDADYNTVNCESGEVIYSIRYSDDEATVDILPNAGDLVCAQENGYKICMNADSGGGACIIDSNGRRTLCVGDPPASDPLKTTDIACNPWVDDGCFCWELEYEDKRTLKECGLINPLLKDAIMTFGKYRSISCDTIGGIDYCVIKRKSSE